MKRIQHSLFVFLIAIASASNSIASLGDTASYELKFASVPEPEGWTLYLLGLGFVLYQFRRCRNKSRTWNHNQDKNSIE
ncbi:hypothetical protein AAKU67_000519 [Oxalobacteraceae bacterium GrIS 2.11]